MTPDHTLNDIAERADQLEMVRVFDLAYQPGIGRDEKAALLREFERLSLLVAARVAEHGREEEAQSLAQRAANHLHGCFEDSDAKRRYCPVCDDRLYDNASFHAAEIPGGVLTWMMCAGCGCDHRMGKPLPVLTQHPHHIVWAMIDAPQEQVPDLLDELEGLL